VTTSVVPSAIGSGLPRTLPMGTAPGQAARSRRAESDDGRWLDQAAFHLEPDLAALDLVNIRALVQTAFAAHLVLEVLDRIADEGFLARDAGLLQRLVKDPPGGADERLAGEVFLVAQLLPDEHEGSPLRALAWHGLSRVAIKRAAATIFLGRGELAQGFDRYRGFGGETHTAQCIAAAMVQV